MTESLFPETTATMTYPDVLESSARIKRAHNKAMKLTMRETLVHHHQETIPEHFKPSNRERYKHYPRARKTKAKKMRVHGSRTDLVASGRTRDRQTRERRITVGGVAASGTMRGRLHLRFPFPTNMKSAKPKAITAQKMAEEIARWTPDEVRKAALYLGARYARAMETLLKPRQRKRLGKT